MVAFISAVVAFLTWLMLSLSGLEGASRLLASAAVLVAIASTLTHYVLRCMKRHCRHDTEALHYHRQAH
jgi:hypothetical protein